MKNVLVAGAGNIGALIACLLAETGDYKIYLADKEFAGEDYKKVKAKFDSIELLKLDISNEAIAAEQLEKLALTTVVSCLPYFCNLTLASIARRLGLHYFDPTEDVEVTNSVRMLADGATTAFVPQCGLAPGFVGLAANSIMQQFDELDTVKLRVGALPSHASNALQYALTWSTDGLINEYGNLCYGVVDGTVTAFSPLEKLEEIEIDGQRYEAFTTSGGLGSLAELYNGKVRYMDYKTIRYPGHCEKLRFLMHDLRLNDDRDTLKRILANAIPRTYQDVIVVYISVTGYKDNVLTEQHFVNKYYPQTVAGIDWSAIQVTTAAGVCAMVDMVLTNPQHYSGFILQETVDYDTFLKNRFGCRYVI